MAQKDTKLTNNENEGSRENRTARIEDKPTASANQKHSAPFYISNSLFDNKLLKQIRCQWAETLKIIRRRKKVENRKKRLSKLKADVTIDLLSDEDEVRTEICTKRQNGENQQESQNNYFTNISLYNDSEKPFQISNVFDVRNISTLDLSSETFEPKQRKRKQKTIQETNTIPCIESIVVIDDDEDDVNSGSDKEKPSSTIREDKATSPLCRSPYHTSPHSTEEKSSYTHDIILIDDDATESDAEPRRSPTNENCIHSAPTVFTQVDEEVSVSLVPRSKKMGTCSSHSHAKALFPMLPDETTVHTVIANRSYELSLTKLREGLATCGVSEFSADEPNCATVPTRRKGNYAPPVAASSPAPISLKLSSDLSISLISDEESDEVESVRSQMSPGLHQMRSTLLPDVSLKLLPRPLAHTLEHNPIQEPKKRKLG